MGQKLGVPILAPAAVPVANLPKMAIDSIWTSYTLLGEGWGLDAVDMSTILSETEYLVQAVWQDKSPVSLVRAILGSAVQFRPSGLLKKRVGGLGGREIRPGGT